MTLNHTFWYQTIWHAAYPCPLLALVWTIQHLLTWCRVNHPSLPKVEPSPPSFLHCATHLSPRLSTLFLSGCLHVTSSLAGERIFSHNSVLCSHPLLLNRKLGPQNFVRTIPRSGIARLCLRQDILNPSLSTPIGMVAHSIFCPSYPSSSTSWSRICTLVFSVGYLYSVRLCYLIVVLAPLLDLALWDISETSPLSSSWPSHSWTICFLSHCLTALLVWLNIFMIRTLALQCSSSWWCSSSFWWHSSSILTASCCSSMKCYNTFSDMAASHPVIFSQITTKILEFLVLWIEWVVWKLFIDAFLAFEKKIPSYPHLMHFR